jgi:hypothetical protein
MAVSLTRYSRATRFTSAGVTFWMARMSSSGELRPATASAWDHSAARPGIEFLRNWASATACRLTASTRSGGMPSRAYPAITSLIVVSSLEPSAPSGKAAVAYPIAAFGNAVTLNPVESALPAGTSP